MCSVQENHVKLTIFYTSSSGLGWSVQFKHFDEESRDYLPSNFRENQSEDDSESTDDGFDRFSSSPVNITSVTMLAVYEICFFSPIYSNNFYYKTFDQCTPFCLKT